MIAPRSAQTPPSRAESAGGEAGILCPMNQPRIILVIVVAALALGGALGTAALANRLMLPVPVASHPAQPVGTNSSF